MIVRNLRLYGWDWDIVALYDIVPSDVDYVLDELKRFDCPTSMLHKAKRNVCKGWPNNGLTYTSNKKRASVMVIGRATCPSQFWNTLDHEKGHVAEHIAEYYNLDHRGEEIEYLKGLIAERVYPEAVRFICGCFNNNEGRPHT